jgi:hypothetical protein
MPSAAHSPKLRRIGALDSASEPKPIAFVALVSRQATPTFRAVSTTTSRTLAVGRSARISSARAMKTTVSATEITGSNVK